MIRYRYNEEITPLAPFVRVSIALVPGGVP